MIRLVYAIPLLQLLINVNMLASPPCKIYLSVLSIVNDPIQAQVEFLDILEIQSKPLRFTVPGSAIIVRKSLYKVSVTAIGFANRTFLANIRDAETYLRIGMSVSRITDEVRRRVRGHVELQTQTIQNTWVRLVPILNQQDVVEFPLSADGSFLFEDVAPGTYVLLLLDDKRLLHAQQVDSSSPDLSIRLPRGDPK